MKYFFSLLLTICIAQFTFSQLYNVEPKYWFSGMQNTDLQLLIYGEKINDSQVNLKNTNVKLVSTITTESPNYLVINLDLKNAKSGSFTIEIKPKIGKKQKIEYELKARKNVNYQGFNSSDAVYLITPDRFANGEWSNDVLESTLENTVDRSKNFTRHGGDIKGIINSLDYISDMGFTALWSSPMLINDMPAWSYHGYAITDMYAVDPRFGTLDEYKELADKCRQKNIKLIMDMVANHIGSEHIWMKDRPFESWINNYEKFGITSHRRTLNQDLYGSKKEKEQFEKGWFVPTMPDLNQQDPYLATYLIQNNIWWIETLGLQGIRQDTYPYPNKEFMSLWARAILTEYPDFSIVGEEWSYNPLLINYWQKGENNDGYESNLPMSMDFFMQKTISEALNEEESWDKGLIKIYEGLANDFAYKNPKNLMIFPDNHDMDRIYTQMHEDKDLTQMAVGLQLILPRIPQLYYGTEILMQNTDSLNNHGLIRTDFPGGWKNDKVNAFTGMGLTTDQKEMQQFVKTILNYRKNNNTIAEGETMHFSPKEGVYVLFRYDGVRKIMCILNKNETVKEVDLQRFEELNINGQLFNNIITGKVMRIKDTMKLPKKGFYLFEIMAL